MSNICAVIGCVSEATVTGFNNILLKSRASDVDKIRDADFICSTHNNKYFRFYKNRKSDKKCCDPWKTHTRNITKYLVEINPEEAVEFDIKGSLICKPCKRRFQRGQRLPTDDDTLPVEDVNKDVSSEDIGASSDVDFTEAEPGPSFLQRTLGNYSLRILAT